MQINKDLVNLYNTIVCAGILVLPCELEDALKELEAVGLIELKDVDGRYFEVKIKGWEDK